MGKGAAKKNKRRGQAILEYILMVVMLSVTVAVALRTSSRTLYSFWTGLTRQVSASCADCNKPDGPELPTR